MYLTNTKIYTIYALLLFSSGYARLHYVTYQHKKRLDLIGHHATIKGTVNSIEQTSHKQYHYVILITVDQFGEDDTFKNYDDPWQLQCYSKQKPRCDIDDVITINNLKVKIKNESFALFLLKEGIHATTYLAPNTYTIVAHPPYSIKRTLRNIKYRILKNIDHKCSTLNTTLIASIFLGNRLYVKEEYKKIKDIFCDWGILHFLARSGIHMVMFMFFLQYIMRWIPIPFLLKQLTLLLLSLIYTLLTWQSVSFARALYTFLWYKSCQIIGLQTNTVHIVTMLSGAFLLCNPMLLFFLDFQLSFGITLVLAITTYYL